MNVVDIKNYLNEYFNYIRTVFLNEYSRYLNPDRITRIKELTDVFKVNLENKFRIYCNEKINVNLDLKGFIEENELNTDFNLKDINIEGRIFIKYLVDNQDNLKEILLSQTIRPMISYIVSYNDILANGLVDTIVLDLKEKYKLPYKFPYESKEANIIRELSEIIPKSDLMRAILNNDFKNVITIYNQNIEYDTIDFETLVIELNKEYDHYAKKIGRVYYTDTLYDYQNIDYSSILKSISKVQTKKQFQIDIQKNRFLSAKNSLQTLTNHLILFNQTEQHQIKTYLIELDHLINKVMTDSIHLDTYYQRLLELEESAYPLSEKLWLSNITYPLNYINGGQFSFLIGDINKDNKKVIETRLFTEQHLIHLKKMSLKYGIIYSLKSNAIVYASSTDILITNVNEESIINSSNVIKVDDSLIEIDNQADSKLITPDLILKSNIRDNELRGKVVLNSSNVYPSSIYCIMDEEGDYNYGKAKELSDMYGLPLVVIPKKLYPNKYSVPEEIKPESSHLKEESLSQRLKNIKKKLLYEEEENMEKVI